MLFFVLVIRTSQWVLVGFWMKDRLLVFMLSVFDGVREVLKGGMREREGLNEGERNKSEA